MAILLLPALLLPAPVIRAAARLWGWVTVQALRVAGGERRGAARRDRGGSFLCHDSYCASYRISARMGVSVGSGSDHTGFRTVATPEMLLNK